MAKVEPELRVGDVWQHKHQSWRRVAIRAVEPERPHDYIPEKVYPARVQVTRNTSRRKQAILVRTLVKEYRLLSGGADHGA